MNRILATAVIAFGLAALPTIGGAQSFQGGQPIMWVHQLGAERPELEASGNVYFVTPEQTIRGDRAVYTPANDTIVLTGDVILTQGQNVMTGGRLTYTTRTEAAQMDGAGRVQGVFYPSSSGN